jgi:hypothetical protein
MEEVFRHEPATRAIQATQASNTKNLYWIVRFFPSEQLSKCFTDYIGPFNSKEDAENSINGMENAAIIGPVKMALQLDS